MITKRIQNLFAAALVAAVAFTTSGTQAQDITPAEARVIAEEAYIYFYPLVIMDVSRKHFTNIEEGKMFARGPMNTFAHARTFTVPTPTDRYKLGDRSNLKPNADGSLDIYLQSESPGAEKESNWLPTPAQPFSLHARLYSPRTAAIDGTWTMPAVIKMK